ncbi:amidase domain-containing protein [Helcococcus kunzii]
MKRSINIIFSLCLLLVVIFTISNNVYAEKGKKEVDVMIKDFFDTREKYSYEQDKKINTKKSSKFKSIKTSNDSIFSKLKVRNKNLEEYLLKYIKLQEVINTKSDIEEEIIKEDINKDITYEGNKIIVFVERNKQSIYTINGIKSEDITFENSKCKFIFDKRTMELIDYQPQDIEEKVLMKADMDKLIDKESEEREKAKSQNDLQVQKYLLNKRDNNFEVVNHKLAMPFAYRKNEFNRAAMVNYANKHAKNYNRNYPDFGKIRNRDCTNFVSQIIKAGIYLD